MVTAAAWSAPVVLIALPAPALAASVSGTLHLNYLGGYSANCVNGVMTELGCGFGDGTPTSRKATPVVHIAADQVYPEPFEDLRGTSDPALTAWLHAGPSRHDQDDARDSDPNDRDPNDGDHEDQR